MKKIVLAVFMAAMALSLSAQINFREGGFAEALEAAKSENKLVFMDCYTTWCGPCKMMTEEVFPQKEAGDFFNAHFANVKFDMEKGEGKELSKQFKIRAYPTFLLLNPEGKETYRVVGGGELQEFILRVKRGLQKENTLEVLEKEYKTGKIMY